MEAAAITERTAEVPRPALALMSAASAAYVAVGLPLFLAPGGASDHFGWRVSRFVAMTAGAWCLGTAALAMHGVTRRAWTAARPCVVHTFSFGLTQLGVALYERERLRAGEGLTWPCLAAGAGAVGSLWWERRLGART